MPKQRLNTNTPLSRPQQLTAARLGFSLLAFTLALMGLGSVWFGPQLLASPVETEHARVQPVADSAMAASAFTARDADSVSPRLEAPQPAAASGQPTSTVAITRSAASRAAVQAVAGDSSGANAMPLVTIAEPLWSDPCDLDEPPAAACTATRTPGARAVFLPAVVAAGQMKATTTGPTGPNVTLTVNTTSMAVDGSISGAAALLANPGPDGKISLREAIWAVNYDDTWNHVSGHTINFDLPQGQTTIAFDGYALQLTAPNTIIDGDKNGDQKPDVLLDGPDGYVQLEIRSDNNLIEYLALTGISLNTAGAHHNVIQGCYIGTDLAGRTSRLEEINGIQILNDAHHNTILGNVIAGNVMSATDKHSAGVLIALGAHDNRVEGNRIGVDVDGNPQPNEVGIGIQWQAYGNRIGGDTRTSTTCTYPCNIISGNSENGVQILSSGSISNVVQGNHIGADQTGSAAIPNDYNGVWIGKGAANNTVGGARPGVDCTGPCNLISGNSRHGVVVSDSGSNYNLVVGNYIGLKASGDAILLNNWSGVVVEDGASYTMIGGRLDSAECKGNCNLISGNLLAGVGILGPVSANNVVQGNTIGTDKAGTGGLGNGTWGIAIIDASTNRIGRVVGGDAIEGNRVAHNTYGGIEVARTATANPTRYNTIRGNQIYSNTGPGIELTPYDGFGVDTNGPNGMQPPPVLYPTKDDHRWKGLAYAANGSVVELFGEGGKTFLGSASVTNSEFTVVVPAETQVKRPVVATLTDVYGNTSEFSPQAVLYLSSPYALPEGHVYAFGTITETWNGQPINATAVSLNGQKVAVNNSAKNGDFYKDDLYSSGWLTAPTTLGDYPVTLMVSGTAVAATTLHVTKSPQLAILTDIKALHDEFRYTGGRQAGRDLYTALKRLSRYAKDHQGIFVDIRRESPVYGDYRYHTGGSVDRRYMGVTIDAYIKTLRNKTLQGGRSSLKYLAIVGDDAVIPFYRRLDPMCGQRYKYWYRVNGKRRWRWKRFKCEQNYLRGWASGIGRYNRTLNDMWRGNLLSDVPYASFDNTDPDTVKRPVPDLAVGRIFEPTPKELAKAIDDYEKPVELNAWSLAAVLHPRNERKGIRWEGISTFANVHPLNRLFRTTINVTNPRQLQSSFTFGALYRFNGRTVRWNRRSVQDALRNANVTVLNTHGYHRGNKLARGWFMYYDLANLPELPGHLLVNEACHAGLSLSRRGYNLYRSALPTSALGRHVGYVAPTTYAWHNSRVIDFYDRMIMNYLAGLVRPRTPTVGTAFKNALLLYNSQRPVALDRIDPYWRMAVISKYGSTLYGLPTQPIKRTLKSAMESAPGVANSLPRSNAATAPHVTRSLNVTVDTPNFQQVTNPDGTVHFEIPNAGALAGPAHYPILPEVLRTYWLPAGATVTSVSLISSTSSLHPDPVTLETATPINGTFGPLPGRATLTETFPSQITWYNTAATDDGVLLVVGVNPLQVDPNTQQVTLYHHVELQVTYDAPASSAAVSGITVNNGNPVQIGQSSLPLRIAIDSDHDQSVLLGWEIVDVTGLPLRADYAEVALTAGSNTVDLSTDTLGWPPGPMLLNVTVDDGADIIASRAETFVAQGRSLTATTASATYSTELTTAVSAQVYDETGAGVAGLSGLFTATLDGSPISPAFSEVVTGSYQAPLSLSGLSEGGHLLKIGLSGAETAVTGFTIDQTPPTATLETLPNLTAGLAIPISWSGEDDGSGIAYYEIQYAVGTTTTWTTWITADAYVDYYPAFSSATFGPSAPVPTQVNQTYYFRIRAVDYAGNAGAFTGGNGDTWTTIFDSPPVERAEAVARVVELTNQERANNGLPPLKLNDLLNESAQGHSDDMAENSYHAHEGSDGSTPGDRILQAGYESTADAENVACGVPTPQEVVTGWMNSPPHRANILSSLVREIGIGYAFNPVGFVSDENCGYHFWTQNFGTRENVYPVIINGEAEVTASANVSLYIYGQGWATEMMVSNAADFSGASWQPYTDTLSWTLAPASGQGTRTVYVRLRNAQGETLDASDDIILSCCTLRGADLALSKTASPDPVAVGDLLTYTVVLTNNGPLAADGVSLVDTLPTGMEFDDYEISQGFCTSASGSVTCNLGQVANSDVVTLTLYVVPGDTAVGSAVNTVKVSSYTSDPNASNNMASATTTVKGGRADLAVSKTDSPDPATINAALTYSITVTNLGPSTATSVHLTDTLPAGVSFGSATPGQGSCSPPNSGEVTCDLGSLASGGSTTITIVVTPTAPGTITNTVQVGLSGDQVDPASGNDTASAQTTVTSAFTVNSTGDGGDSNPGDGVCNDGSGQCTLRAAIQEANAYAGMDMIRFTIPGAGPHTIRPGSALPAISDPTIVNGTTEPDFAGTPVIELDGSGAGADVAGLTIIAGSSTVRGLAINRFSGHGIMLSDNDGNVIAGNFIGTDAAGSTDLGNGGDGVHIFNSANNVIGGETAADRNVISGNGDDGIDVGGIGEASGNLIQGNYIGVNAPGVAALGNTYAGVFVSDATSTTIESNVISANMRGVYITGSGATGNVVRANKIGTDAAGTADLGNAKAGVHIEEANDNIIGGNGDGEGNLISGNDEDGVFIEGSLVKRVQVLGNRIGTNAAGTAALSNAGHGVRIGTDTGAFWQSGGWNHTVSGNLISGNGGLGILLAGFECTVADNKIGTDVNGDSDLGNFSSGIYVSSAMSNTISANLISGNGGDGVGISNAFRPTRANKVQGNRIGANAAGTAALGNDGHGVWIDGEDNVVGGSGPGQGNLISGNAGNGVDLGSAFGAAFNTLVQGNFIGTDVAGTAAIANAGHGVAIGSFSQGNLVGGTADGAGNVISGNAQDGVAITGYLNTVQGNIIGADVNGSGVIGNDGNGVGIYWGMASSNAIGGTADGAGNTIAYNGGAGILLEGASTGNALLSNRIFTNDGLGIDLGNDGVTANDAGDGDSGENNLQNYPLLALAAPGSTLVQGTLNSTADTAFTLQFFSDSVCDPSNYGEGRTYLGSTSVTTDGDGNASFSTQFTSTVPIHHFVTATATDANGNTSEFSRCTAVDQWADLAVTKTGQPQAVLTGQPVTYTVVVTNAGPSAASAVTLTDVLPAGVTFASATSSQGACNGTSTVVCSLGSLASGATATVTIRVTPTSGGAQINTAAVTSSQPDPNPANNSATATTSVNPADLAVAKADAPDPVMSGGRLTYTITVTNHGPQPASGVTVTDTLPAGVSYASATPSQGSCSPPSFGGPGGAVVCDLGSLANGATATVTLLVTPTVNGVISNSVTVAANEPDPNPANDTATALTSVSSAIDLALSKTASHDPAWASYPLTYALVVGNSGPLAASGVVLTDTLDAQAHVISATPDQGACNPPQPIFGGSVLTCTLGTINPGAQLTVTLVITPASDGDSDEQILVNKAAVAGLETDANLANNSAWAVSHIQQAADQNWDPRFGPAGLGLAESLSHVYYNVTSIAFGPGQTLYAAGNFNTAGSTDANDLAMWDGATASWHAVGRGVYHWEGGYITALAVDGDDLIVGGKFTGVYNPTGDLVNANYIARWDGATQTWSPLGNGVDGIVRAVAIGSQGQVYVGGEFTTAGGVSAPGIAVWNGSSWSALGGGVTTNGGAGNGTVQAIAVAANGDLYVGGDFTEAGGVGASYIARWETATSSWHALGSGLNGTANDLALSGDGLAVSGGFTQAGGATAWNIAWWDASTSSWSGLASDIPGGSVEDVAVIGSDVYVVGWFDEIVDLGGTPVSANRFARWDGSSWSEVGGGIGATPRVIAAQGSVLYVGGDFATVGDWGASRIARWDGSQWSALTRPGYGQGLESNSGLDRAYALTLDGNGDVLAAGGFQAAGRVAARDIARWDGSGWQPLASNVNGTLFAVAVERSNGTVYAGGDFTQIDGASIAYLAQRDPSSGAWSSLGTGVDDKVWALDIDGSGNLYAGGEFWTAGGVTVSFVARWDGATSSWHALGSGVDGRVRAIAVNRTTGDVYVGGEFSQAGGVTVNGIARWDGSSWHALGSGVGGYASAIVVDEATGNVYVGGNFSIAGGVTVNGIARWDGTTSSWHALGNGVMGGWSTEVDAIAIDGNDVYVGGEFTTADGRQVNNVAHWDGSSWSALGSGIAGSAESLLITDDGLYVAGMLYRAGRKPVHNLARWMWPAPDLQVSKADGPDPVAAGQTLVYTITVANAGPLPATGVTLTDTLPAGVSFGSAQPSQGSCSPPNPGGPGGAVICNLGSIASDASVTVVIQVTPTATGMLVNTATVAASETDRNPADNMATATTAVNPADLALSKADSPDPLLAGQTLIYTITVTNHGPIDATGVTVTDTLPAGVSFTAATPSQGSCSPPNPGGPGGAVICHLGSLASGASATVVIQVTPTASGPLVNTATAAADQPDVNADNNTATETTAVIGQADLALSKADEPDPAAATGPLTYTLTVVNNGPSAAQNVTLTDTLPASVNFGSAQASQGSCSPPNSGGPGGAVTCSLGNLANGASATVTLVVTPTATGQITNAATVAALDLDPVPGNNMAQETTSVLPAADLALSKLDTPDPVLAGLALTYTLAITNSGPADATGVVLTDVLPAGVAFGSATASQGSCSPPNSGGPGGAVTCNLGDLASGGSATVVIVVTPAAAGIITNTATVAANEPDPRPADNTARQTTTVGDPTLLLDEPFDGGMPDSWTVANGGGNATWTTENPCSRAIDPPFADPWAMIDSDCAGAGDSQDDSLVTPEVDARHCSGLELSFSNQFRWYDNSTNETGDVDVSTDGGTTWTNLLRMQGGDDGFPTPNTKTLDLTAAAAGQRLQIRFHYYNGEYDWWWAVDNVRLTCQTPTADLSLVKTDAPDPVPVNTRLTYTFTIANAGPDEATGVTLSDALPGSVTFGSATASQGTCSPPDSGGPEGAVTCSLGNLASGANATVTIVVTPSTPSLIANTAQVTADQRDPDLQNNSATETTAVSPLADLAVSKRAAVDPVAVNTPLTYTVVVSNHGPSPATAVVLTDALPAGVTFGSATASQGTCSPPDSGGSGGAVTCDLGSLASGAAVTATIMVTPVSTGTLTNTVMVAAAEADPTPGNNTASEATTVSLYAADFSRGLPPGWTVIDGGDGIGVAATWTTQNPCQRSIDLPSTDPWLMVDSDCAGPGDTQDEQLISPLVDVSACPAVELSFTSQFRSFSGNEIGDVDVSNDGGQTWTNVLRLQGSDDGYPTPREQRVDITAAAAGQPVQMRFYYYGAHYDWWWAVDNVALQCGSAPVCFDFNGDGWITVADIMMTAARWGLTADNPDPDGNPATPNYEARFDVDGSGTIDVLDIEAAAQHWGEKCP